MRAKERFLVVAAATALTVLLTWPIAARFTTAGRVDSGDGRYSVWNVAWVAHALTTNPFELYHANIFYPHPNALAFSEANVVAGALAVPVWLLTHNAYATTNWAILLSFVLSGVAMYALVRRLTHSVAGATLAGFEFAFCPFLFSHIPHIQLLMAFGLPLVLLALHAFVEAPSGGRAVRLGAMLALAGLACGYYGVYGGLIAGLGVLWFGVTSGRWRNWRYWGLALTAAGVALVIVAPFFAPYTEIQEAGFGRTLEDARIHSVRWRSYLASPILLHRWMLPLIGTWREVLFPGFLAIAFTLVALVKTFGRRGEATVAVARSVVGFYLLIGVLAVWASLGPAGGLYRVLYEVMPFFSMLRAPARFGFLVTLAMAVLGAVGLASVERVLAGRARGVLVIAVLVLALATSTVGPLALTDGPRMSLAHERLIALPKGAVAEFPYFSGIDLHRHTEYMLMSTWHWKPLVNGYSDHTPAEVLSDVPKLAMFPASEAWPVLRDHRTRYVMIHWYLYEPEDRRRIIVMTRQLRAYLRSIVDATDVSLFEIVGWPAD